MKYKVMDLFRFLISFAIFAIIIMFICGIIGLIFSLFWLFVKIGFCIILGAIVAIIILKIIEYFKDKF